MNEVLREKRENKSKEKVVDTLNSLVQINHVRIAGYETASKHTEEAELKDILISFIETSQNNNRDLTGEIIPLGGKPVVETKSSVKFFRTWIDVKVALTVKNREAIFNSFIVGEEKAIEKYKDVLSKDVEHLNSEQQTIIGAQLAALQADHNKLIALRDELVEA